MTPRDVEVWAGQVLEEIAAGRTIEDTLVELKAEWPTNHLKTARRIAAHANAARGETILWLFGASDKDGGSIPGVNPTEFQNWWGQVRKIFNEDFPVPIERRVIYGKLQVMAVAFLTNLAPYVITVPEKEVGFSREVPFREGQDTKSATRSQLVRILAPVNRLPLIEILTCSATVGIGQPGGTDDWSYSWSLDAKLFIAQPADQHTTLATHKSEAAIILDGVEILSLDVRQIQVSGVSQSQDATAVRGSATFSLNARNTLHTAYQPTFPNSLRARVTFAPPFYERTISAECSLGPTRSKKDTAIVRHYSYPARTPICGYSFTADCADCKAEHLFYLDDDFVLPLWPCTYTCPKVGGFAAVVIPAKVQFCATRPENAIEIHIGSGTVHAITGPII